MYGAASPEGQCFSLFIDGVSKDCTQIFLDEFSKTLDRDVILVMDNAGWHHELNVPDNIEIVYLPPYSPELNPIERLWRYIKEETLKNKVYNTLADLEKAVAQFLLQIKKDAIASICACSYVL